MTGTKPVVPRKQKYIQSEKEKALYEEDMFTRLPVTKADKLARYSILLDHLILSINLLIYDQV